MKKSVFITGATGLIGTYLLKEMIESKNVGRIFLLCRKKNEDIGFLRIKNNFNTYGLGDVNTEKIQLIEGDIAKEKLGMNAADFDLISSEVDVIHHLAAWVNHIKSYGILEPTNVGSVREIINIAALRKSKVINFYSTLGSAAKKDLAGKYVDDFPDEENLITDMGYLITKWKAEKVLSDYHKNGGKVNIFRLGYISGDSTSGIGVYNNNQFMLFIKGCVQLKAAPFLKRKINLTPVDFTAKIISLDKFMNEGGNVLNLYNCFELITWDEIIEWLNSRGYEIEQKEFYDWQKILLENSEANALKPLLSLYGVEGSHDKIVRFGREIDIFRHEKMVELSAEYKLYPKKVKYDLLDTYLSYMRKSNFL